MNGGKRCVSGCKGLPEEICTKSPRCTYFKGKRPYCRLSNRYQMKEGCKVVSRMTKKNKENVAYEKLKQFFRQRKPSRHLDAFQRERTKKAKKDLSAPAGSAELAQLMANDYSSPSPAKSEDVLKIMMEHASPAKSADVKELMKNYNTPLSTELNEIMTRPSRSTTRGNPKTRRAHAPSRR
jgi:hypothetical protein